jgi:secreted trypsin-like serine protease
MIRTKFSRKVALVAAAVAALAAPVLANESTRDELAAERATINWAREYVELRVQEKNARAFGPKAADQMAKARIVGGTVAAPDSNPFHVGLLIKEQPDNFHAQYCAGTLVEKSFIVTAAHCSDFVLKGDVQVLTGTQRLDGSGRRRNVKKITIHPSWNPVTFDNDIAIWELKTDVNRVTPAKLPRRDPSPGTRLLATGWGNTESFGFPLDLMAVKVPLVARAICNGTVSYNGQVTSNMLCAGLSEGGKDTCQGDSGGPLTRKKGGEFKELVGITSWGSGCADPNFFGVYTRVSNYKAFIENVIE